MATTTAHLQSNSHGEYAWVLLIDGLDFAFTTHHDVSAVASGFGTAHDFYGGLHIIGETGQRIAPLDPQVSADSLTILVTDADAKIRETFLAPNRSTSTTTFLEQNLAASDTAAMFVRDVADFDASGTLYIGQERLDYDATDEPGAPDDDEFQTLTRGQFSLFKTNSGADFGRAHRLRSGEEGGAATAPIVSTEPRVFYNRMVGLYLCHRESTFATKANSRLVWAGQVKSYGDEGSGSISFSCTSVLGMLSSTVMQEQFIAKAVTEKTLASSATMSIRVDADSIDYDLSAAIPGAGTNLSVFGVVSALNQQINTWTTGSDIDSRDKWQVSIEDLHVTIKVVAGSAISAGAKEAFQFGLPNSVWKHLGFTPGSQGGGKGGHASGDKRYLKTLERVSSTEFVLRAENNAIAYGDPSFLNPGDTFDVTDVRGSWVTQPSFPARYGAGTEGFVQVGDWIVPVSYAAPTFTVKSLPISMAQVGAASGDHGPVPLAADADPPDVKQVWLEHDDAGTLLLRIMLSTGSSGYNHATHDVYTADGFGLGLPASMVDADSFASLDLPFELFLSEPTSFLKLLERVMAASNRYLVWKDSRLTLIHPGSDNPNASSTIDLTEDNKGRPDDRSRINYSAEGLINRVVFKYGSAEHAPVPDAAKVANTQITVEMSHSITDYGARKTVEIDGTGILDAKRVTDYVIAPALAYFSQPLAYITRTYNAKLAHLTPGDIVTISDSYAVDPTTGTRGITNLAAWVIETSFDWRTGVGELTAVFLPGLPQSRYARFAPSARVDDTQANGGLSGADKVLTCYAHGFSRSTDTTADATLFPAGSKIHVVQLSPSNPAAPVEWYRTVDTQTGNTITLTAALSSPAWDPALKYAVEFDDKTAVIAAQRTDNAFIADDADGSTGYAANDHNVWSSANNTWLNARDSVTYPSGYYKVVNSYWTAGEPLSAHKLWLAIEDCNHLFAHHTRHTILSEPGSFTEQVNVSTAWQLAYGPIKVPVYGAPTTGSADQIREFRARPFMRRTTGAGNAECRITSSDRMLKGTALNSLTFGGRTVQTTFVSTSATSEWVDDEVFVPAIFIEDGVPHTWLSVEIRGTTGATGCGFKGIVVTEEELS